MAAGTGGTPPVAAAVIWIDLLAVTLDADTVADAVTVVAPVLAASLALRSIVAFPVESVSAVFELGANFTRLDADSANVTTTPSTEPPFDDVTVATACTVSELDIEAVELPAR